MPVAAPLTVQQPHHPSVTNPGVHFVYAKSPQPFGNNLAGFMLFKADLGMRVQSLKNTAQFIFGSGNYRQNIHHKVPFDGTG